MQISEKFDETYRLQQFNDNCRLYFSGKDMGINNSQTRQKLPAKLHQKIVTNYFGLYFNDILYRQKHNWYFLFTGKLIPALYAQKVHQHRDYKKLRNSSICYVWVQKPSKMFLWITFRKLSGLNNALPKIEKLFKKNHDIDLMANFETVTKSHNPYNK